MAGTRRRRAPGLTHLDSRGRARMVETGGKPVSAREATAEAFVRMAPATVRLVRAGSAPKGDVLAAARIAGILAAKRTPDLVPLCHPVALAGIEVDATVRPGGVHLLVRARAVDRTGVEMEAMTAAAVAALTVYDMVKGLDRGASVEGIRLLAKSGGRSGDWRRPSA